MANGIKRNACTLKVFTVLGVGWGRSQLNVKAIQIITRIEKEILHYQSMLSVFCIYCSSGKYV